ncbi:hypothetical protein D3C71_1572250 [compost metagenome]
MHDIIRENCEHRHLTACLPADPGGGQIRKGVNDKIGTKLIKQPPHFHFSQRMQQLPEGPIRLHLARRFINEPVQLLRKGRVIQVESSGQLIKPRKDLCEQIDNMNLIDASGFKSLFDRFRRFDMSISELGSHDKHCWCPIHKKDPFFLSGLS